MLKIYCCKTEIDFRNCEKTCSGTMTLVPHKVHPSSTLSSALHLHLNWLSSCELGYPCCTKLWIDDKWDPPLSVF